VNAAAGETIEGFATSGLAGGQASVYTSQTAALAVDVVGFYINSYQPPQPVAPHDPSNYTWNPLGQLAATTTNTATTTYDYNTDGARIAQHLPNGDTTYYLGNLEATRNTTGTWNTLRRTYTQGNIAVASRTIDGNGNNLTWLLGNAQGSLTTTIPTGTNTPTTRYYQPYGGARGPAPGTKPTTTGFLNQHEDQTTLTYLNNRYYDPTVGVFLSVDPLVTSTGDPYLYGHGNPVTLSDPSGLEPCRLAGTCLGEYLDQSAIDHYNSDMGAVSHRRAAKCDWHCAQARGDLGLDRMPSELMYVETASIAETVGFLVASTIIGAMIAAAVSAGPAEATVAGLASEFMENGAGDQAQATLQEAAVDGAATEAAGTGGIETTAHGATRIAGEAATRGGVLSEAEIGIVREAGTVYNQSNGAIARVLQQADGRFSVVVDGDRGLMTTFQNLSQSSLDRLAKNYGWELP
jgi:RHS repeat-associated protein